MRITINVICLVALIVTGTHASLFES